MIASSQSRSGPVAVLPRRDGDPGPSTGLKDSNSSSEILRFAEMIGIPWKRILLEEIEAEQKLRRYIGDIQAEISLRAVTTILSFSFLRSWRARDQLETLACRAQGADDRAAVGQLRLAFRGLIGKSERDQVAFSEHLRFAYERVLLLQRVSRAAARSRGTLAERLAFVCATARCCFDDAAWAVCRESSPRRGQRFEAAVRKVREEGFLIPRAETEARSLAALRRIVRASSRSPRSASLSDGSPASVSVPRRVPLPVDAL